MGTPGCPYLRGVYIFMTPVRRSTRDFVNVYDHACSKTREITPDPFLPPLAPPTQEGSGNQTNPQSRAQPIFRTRRGKIVWSTAYSVFVPSATLVALQSDCFMKMTSRTA